MALTVRTVYLRGAFDTNDLAMIHDTLRVIEQRRPHQLFTINISVTPGQMQEAYEVMTDIIGEPGGQSIVMTKLARGEL